jgi:2-phosphoglycerate kinase
MAKLVVINQNNDTRIPFLRGMLVKSLQQAGLEFIDAYNLATDIRDEFDDADEITTKELRERIIEVLTEEHPGAVLRQYSQEGISRESLIVVGGDGSRGPFSRGIHVQRLESCSIDNSKCNSITRKIHSYLIKHKIKEVTSKELTALTYSLIKQDVDQLHADYYLIWRDFLKNGYPLLLFIGGIPGCGKSTIATEVANRLGIVRTQSTDMLREVMRIMIPEKLSPSLHTSSFKAGKAMHIPELYKNPDEHLLYGFQMQSEMVEVACEAVVQRALNENVSMIVEGVHIRPSLLSRIVTTEAVVVPVTLAVLNKKRLVRFIKGRSSENKQRRAQRYLENIDDIWQLQTILLSEADNEDIEIIDNKKVVETTLDIIKIIIQTIAVKYKGQITALRKQYS